MVKYSASFLSADVETNLGRLGSAGFGIWKFIKKNKKKLLNVEEGLEAKIHHLKFIEFEPLTYLPIQSKIVN
jgi:hypothetical protein